MEFDATFYISRVSKSTVGIFSQELSTFHLCRTVGTPNEIQDAHFDTPNMEPKNDFIAGQRYRSEAEPELGLGRVEERDGRRVRIHFPAADETRIFAIESAPLRRAAFQVGDTLIAEDGEPFEIAAVETVDGLLRYRDGKGTQHPESAVAAAAGPSDIIDRLKAGQIDPGAAFELRVQAQNIRHRIRRSPVRGFVGAKIDLLPHQIHIAREVAERPRPRVLLADEVGLGKTIEACLILHRLHCTGRAERILILVPEALVHQWFVELYRRFHLLFSIHHAEDTDYLANQLVITSVENLSSDPETAVGAVTAGWDLVIVDEAHHLAWSPEAPSPAYAIVEALGQASPGLLLLTATPEQLGRESHFARLRLLDPERYPSLEAFETEADHYQKTVKKAESLDKKGDSKALRKLLDESGPGRSLYRNTRSAISGFPERVVHPVPVEDKTDWLAELLREHKTEKFLLICQGREAIETLDAKLRDRIHVKTALFHEGLTLLQRDRNAAWFAEDDGARLLLCSEIGGEGRNFQFCQHLILFDLPAHPERLEQRIGRLDRIGQADTIHIHVPFLEGTAEARRFAWFHEGMNAFAAPLRGAHLIMKQFQDRFESGEAADKLNAETRAARDVIEAQLEAGRDRLLELHSCDPERADTTIGQIRAAERDPELHAFLLRLFDAAGVFPEDLGNDDWLLKPGPTYTGLFPGFSGESDLAATFTRSRALAREDITFLTSDHPMITEGIDQLLTTPQGSVAAEQRVGSPDVHLELLYMLECPAPARLHLDRFLPPTPIHFAVDPSGSETELDPAPDPPSDPHLRNPLVEHPPLQALVPGMIESADELANERAAALLEAARGAVAETLDTEIERMQSLASVNPDISEDDVEELRSEKQAILAALQSPALRLDAMRLMLFAPEA